MSIARRQLEAIMNQILQKEFQNGHIPTIEDVISKLNEVFKNRGLGMPTVKYRPAPYRGRSSPQDWNDTIEEIYTDLSILYEENIDQINRILVDFEYSEVEKRKLERKIKELENRIDELLLLNNNTDGYLYSVYDDFLSLVKIDLNNTTAWVDLSLHEVTPAHSKIGNVKIDLTGMDIKGELLTPKDVSSSKDIEPLGNILDDNLNTSWLHKIVAKKQQEIKYSVTISLKGDPVTRLQINPNVPGNTRFEIRYTEDGINWRLLGSTIAQETLAFDFPEAELRGIQLILSRAEHDEIQAGPDGLPGYVYYFGITNVSLYKMGFEEAGILQSKPLPVVNRQNHPVTINKISLEVKEEVPPGSSINYYVALNEPDPSWQPITPISRSTGEYPKIIDLKTISSIWPVRDLLAASAVPMGEPVNGLQFYELSSRNQGNANWINPARKIIRDSESPMMYKGIDQFRCESYIFEYDMMHEPSFADWIDLPSNPATGKKVLKEDIITRYIDVGTKISFSPQEQFYSYRYVTLLYLDETKEPIKTKLRVDSVSPDAKLNVKVYVNGTQISTNYTITTSGIDIQYPFVSGWNTLMIFVYKPDGTDCSLDLGFTPKEIASKIRAEKDPMIYVSLFDLLYNIQEKDTDKYSLTDDNVIIIGGYQKQQGARYEFYYKYTIENNPTNELLFKAELIRGKNAAVPPKLKGYRVRVS